MQTFPFAACLAATAFSTAAYAEQDYAKTMPDLAKIECSFRPVKAPLINGIAVEIRRVESEDRAYLWIEDDFPPLPILPIFSHPLAPETAMTTVVSLDANGEIGMISYQSTGEAILSKHYKPADELIRWTAQKGTCIETKGS
ncbi:MAG: hypothetical protein H7245_20250 [Candidatus Saccharibacteria bacterium]|nr:hypothetical protein [Pseudorhodobacter sp.]